MAKKTPSRTVKKQRRSPWLWPVLLGAAVLVVAAVFLLTRDGGQGQPSAALPPEVSVAEAMELREGGAFILDVREPHEWEEFHIPGATLIPLAELEGRASEVPQDREVVVVCRTGNRSATGRDILRAAGLESVASMAGGMVQWRSAGHPTVSGP